MQKRLSGYLVAFLTALALLVMGGPSSVAEEPRDDPIIQHDKYCKTAQGQRDDRCQASPGTPKVAIPAEIGELPPAAPEQFQVIATVAARPPGSDRDQPGYIKGLYMTYYSQGSSQFRAHAQNLLETTELNAIVLDVKGDFGKLTYQTDVQLALDIGAADAPMVKDWETWIGWFQERQIYTIARIVVFKDEPLAVARPDLAVIDKETDEVWRDRENLGWVDPSQEEVWDYNIALAVEAAEKGFDEIQFDYVRFPTDGQISNATFAVENTPENRVAAISSFLARADAALEPYEVKLAADVFGYTTWRVDDMGIGQQIEALAPYLDVLSPMLYPSTFEDGLPRLPEYSQAIAFPYEVVHLSTKRAVERVQAVNPELVVRPWIQDFSDYRFDRRTYTPQEIRRQMDGAREAGARGWLLWDPRVRYTVDALVSAEPSYPPNIDGEVLVLEYHLFGRPEGRWQRTPENFRADLERLRRDGFYPINLRDLIGGDLGMVPAGKRPVVLTFDDSSQGQFNILPDGTIDPESAVGILKAFHDEHPADWPLRGTFFVLQDVNAPGRVLFGQPEWAQQKLQMLVDWGMEVGSHTISHADLSQLSDEELQWQLGQSKFALEAMLPGYDVVSLSVPFGNYPANEFLLAQGVYQGQVYNYEGVVEVAGGLAPSPHSPQFDPYHIPRVQAIDSELEIWLGRANQPGVHYVSAGE